MHLYVEKILLVVFYEIMSCLLCKVVCYIKYSNGCAFPFQGTKKIIFIFLIEKNVGKRNYKYNPCKFTSLFFWFERTKSCNLGYSSLTNK